ncbi:VRR-NUC domain-containing protein [Candidatus Litorirhabdus singularis]|nr:VRR-NUC domain-containing protein [Candidatus Litorirhabdus singularis]
MAPVELHPLYYLHNFEVLCDTVEAQYGDLLTAQELQFLQDFRACEDAARGLFVRLTSRRGTWFRPEKLNYPELTENLTVPLEQLASRGLVSFTADPGLELLLELCLKGELLQLFADILAPDARKLRKPELAEQLLQLALDSEEVNRRWQDWYTHSVIEVHGPAVVEVLQLLFFGNRRQSLTDFVLSDLGVASYESYALDRRYRLFASRAQVDEYLQAAVLREQFYNLLEQDDVEAMVALVALLPVTRSSHTPQQQRWDKLRNRLGRQLERYQQPAAALRAYAGSHMHPARERSVRLLESQGELEQALELCDSMAMDPWCEAEMDFQRRKSVQLARKNGAAVTLLKPPVPISERLVLAPTERRVEEAAAAHYRQHWQWVGHVENSMVNALFGLALWEQIFAEVAGAFVNPFQSAPLDMYSGTFYRTRRSAIDARLDELAQADLAAVLLASYDAHFGISNRWVSWRGIEREMIATAAQIIPVTHLIAMWRRILFDPQANRSGLPDLLALDPEHGYCMIEVKGPGDQLQLNQKRWLRYFSEQDIPVKVAWVSWHDA